MEIGIHDVTSIEFEDVRTGKASGESPCRWRTLTIHTSRGEKLSVTCFIDRKSSPASLLVRSVGGKVIEAGV